ncbi:hypothetical protein WJX81_001385 [Elliptochloris bilobata]|uniref:Uncharacterized protein n=1 Tax=Elliptochloris bilobata TaxID=381761 RepID=A0AAW1RTS3_9CHLO
MPKQEPESHKDPRYQQKAQKGMVAVAEWPSPLAAPPPETPKQRREGVREGGPDADHKGPVMTKFAAATVYLQEWPAPGPNPGCAGSRASPPAKRTRTATAAAAAAAGAKASLPPPAPPQLPMRRTRSCCMSSRARTSTPRPPPRGVKRASSTGEEVLAVPPQVLEAGEMPPLPALPLSPRDLEAEWGIAGAPHEPLAAMESLSPALSPPLHPSQSPSLGPHGVANAFCDVPDDLFGASFWLDGPGGADFGPAPAAAAAAFPSVCSAPVPGCAVPRRGGPAADGMGTAKPSCESITEHFDLPFMPDMLAVDGFERICAAATASMPSPLPTPLPPRPPRSSSHSDAGSSPRRSSLDASPVPSTNPSAPLGMGVGAGAGELEPMQEEGLQTLTLFDADALALAQRAHTLPAQGGEDNVRMDVLTTALKAANNKIKELNAALSTQAALRSYAQRLQDELQHASGEVETLRGQLACLPGPDPGRNPSHQHAVAANMF